MRLVDADQFGVISLQGKSEEFIDGVKFMLEKIDQAPTVEERSHGEWQGNVERHNMVTRICTSCGDRSVVGYFCMWCGADMRTKEGEEK